MKKIFLYFLIFWPHLGAQPVDLLALLEVKEPEINEDYYQLLAQINDNNPDLSFVNTKELIQKIKKKLAKKNTAVHCMDFSEPISKAIKNKDGSVFFFDMNTLEDSCLLNDILEEFLESNAQYHCAYAPNALIVFPARSKITVSPLVRATTISRLYDGQNYTIEQVIEAELCIAQAKDIEKAAVEELGKNWLEKYSDTAGLSGHYALWAGLINHEHEKYDTAKEYLLEAKKRGLNHWRIDWYLAMAQANCFFDIR